MRFAIDPHKIDKFVKFLAPVKAKYKKISFNINLMYLSKWHLKNSFTNKILDKLNGKCNAVAFVDSYGALKPLEVYKFFKGLKKFKSFKIGCHFHNNCGLALANTLSAIEGGCDIADTTIRGMGRGAGNAETELLLAIFKTTKLNISNYEFDNLLDHFDKLKNNLKWGSSFSYAYAANRGYSQSKMMDLLQNRRLDTSVALQAISSKLNKVTDLKFSNFKRLQFIKNSTPIIIGGAPSFARFGSFLLKNLKKNIPIILSGSNALFNFEKLNLKIKNPLILVLSGSELKKIKIFSNNKIFKKLKIHSFIAEKDFFSKDVKIKKTRTVLSESCAINPLLLTGLLLIKLRCKKLFISNFDGEYSTEKGRAIMRETEAAVKFLKSKKLQINSLNKTYLNVKKISIWSNDKFFYTNS